MSAPEPRVAATIVVCEDDEPTLELLCDHLHADRFAALPAPTASDALRLCHFKAPDLMLLDLACRTPTASTSSARSAAPMAPPGATTLDFR